MRRHLALPRFSLRFIHVWRRNLLVWRKLALPSMLGNLADPMLYMLGLGYGLGSFLPDVNGTSYIAFIAAGTVCSSTMMTSSFEAMYSAFSRMHVQRTWDAIMNAPMTLDDIVLGELVWAASKALLSGFAVLMVASLLGLAHWPSALGIVPLIFLTGLAFAGPALIMTALSPSYDFFMFYMTLAITPMMLVSGVFFPVEQLPGWLQMVTAVLPLPHAVQVARPLMTGEMPGHLAVHLLVLAAYAVVSFYVALVLIRRRLLK